MSDQKGMTESGWTDWPVNDTIKYAKQTVGLAVEMTEKYIVAERKDNANYLYEIKPDENNQINYFMTVCAEKENFGVKNASQFFDYVNEWKDRSDLIVKIK